jgi:hypothetical protein
MRKNKSFNLRFIVIFAIKGIIHFLIDTQFYREKETSEKFNLN